MSHMLAVPNEPLFILKDHVASEAVNLRAKVNGKGEFTFSKSSKGQPGEVLFTVDSRSGLRAPKRLVKDATGTGILELWRNPTGDESYISRPNNGPLPPLAVVAPRKTVSKDKVDIYVKIAARDVQETKLEVRGQDVWKRNTLVYWGDDLVMQLRFVNYVTSYVPFASNQWDVAVAQGFDLSLACTIVAFLGTTLYDNTKFRSSYGLEVEETNDKPSGRWSNKRLGTAIAIGAGAGAGAGAG